MEEQIPAPIVADWLADFLNGGGWVARDDVRLGALEAGLAWSVVQWVAMRRMRVRKGRKGTMWRLRD